MLQNAYFLAKIGADTAENEQHFAEILPKTGNYPTGPPGAGGARAAWRATASAGQQPARVAARSPEPEGSEMQSCERCISAVFQVAGTAHAAWRATEFSSLEFASVFPG